MKEIKLNRCPVCGKMDLGYLEVCDFCDWQNDQYQLKHPDRGGCANNMSLNEAREAYRRGERIR